MFTTLAAVASWSVYFGFMARGKVCITLYSNCCAICDITASTVVNVANSTDYVPWYLVDITLWSLYILTLDCCAICDITASTVVNVANSTDYVPWYLVDITLWSLYILTLDCSTIDSTLSMEQWSTVNFINHGPHIY